jgi:hypothetical protein
MTRVPTLAGYVALAIAVLVLELAARRSERLPAFGDVLDVVIRRWPWRVAVLAGWLWLGWHLFARVEWR